MTSASTFLKFEWARWIGQVEALTNVEPRDSSGNEKAHRMPAGELLLGRYRVKTVKRCDGLASHRGTALMQTAQDSASSQDINRRRLSLLSGNARQDRDATRFCKSDGDAQRRSAAVEEAGK